MATESVFIIGALAVACVGGIADILTSKIPNRLTYGGMIVAIGAHLVIGGWSGLGASIAGGLIGGGAFFVFFLLHAMGGGDIKLIAAVGCFVGPKLSIEIVLASAIAGGILAIAYALWQRRLKVVLRNVYELVKFHAAVGAESHPSLNLSNQQAVRLPYGVAIAAGVIYAALAFYHRGGI
ncbi:MAG: prepilin peptidase [Acidobacteria bacterium]|nr:MAG: prepilin peptidase [Acidobacteriota bacterium]